jgi:hypothetical protein
MIVKFHSNQQKIDLFIAENVSQSINQHQEVVVADMEEVLVEVLVEDLVAMVDVIEVPDLVEETTDHEKCLTQNAATVEMIVKYHSNQKKTDLFIAENASKTTNLNQDKVGIDLVEDLAVEDPADLVEIEVLDLVIETTDHEKCMTQNVGIVELIVKYHSNQEKTDLFIAEIASKATNKIRNSVLSKFQNSFIL